jgi:hypothetical protein
MTAVLHFEQCCPISRQRADVDPASAAAKALGRQLHDGTTVAPSIERGSWVE